MRTSFKPLVVGSLLLLLGGAGCADLDVTNPNAPDAQRAVSTAGDVQALIAGTYNTWYTGINSWGGPGPFLSNQAFQHNAPWANFGMEHYGRIPRISIQNQTSDVNYSYVVYPWTISYRSIAAIADGLKAVEKPEVAAELGPQMVAALKAYAKFNQALAHATLATIYDEVFIVTETTNLTETQEPVPYAEAMTQALAMFDEAIALCSASFTLPFDWMSANVSNVLLKQLAHSYAARFRAQVARTAEERTGVDWSAVIRDVDSGITQDFTVYAEWDVAWFNGMLYYGGRPDWGNLGNYLHGMADTSGNYQKWLALTDANKSHTFPDGSPVLFITPDKRYPQGTTVAEQRANPGTHYRVVKATGENTWARPDRGTWRWSYYKHARAERYKVYQEWDVLEITHGEMRLLKAEALFRTNNRAGAAAIINETRVAAGLNATDASGTNTSKVPTLPNGQPGDLWEMLKWEKRHATVFTGIAMAGWFFDGRGWGDLYKGTPLHFGIPCREIQVLQMGACKNYGGPGGEFGSPGSTYKYPHEG